MNCEELLAHKDQVRNAENVNENVENMSENAEKIMFTSFQIYHPMI